MPETGTMSSQISWQKKRFQNSTKIGVEIAAVLRYNSFVEYSDTVH